MNIIRIKYLAIGLLTLFGLGCSPTDTSSPLPEDFFVKFYGDQSVETGEEVIVTDNGFVIMGSSNTEELKGVTGTDDPVIDTDFYLVFTDAEGNEAQNSPILFDLDRENQIPGTIKATSDGGFIMIGTTVITTGLTGNTADQDFYTDIIVYKLAGDGQITWTQTYSNMNTTEESNEEGYDIIEDTDGGFVMVGTTTSVDETKDGFVSTDTDPTDIYMHKIDADGNRLWELTLGFVGSDQGRTILKTPGGGFAILGSTTVDKDGAGQGENIIFATTDANGGKGTEQFKVFGSGPASATNDYAATMRATSDGGFIIVGTSSEDAENVSTDGVDDDNRIILMKVTANRTLTYFETLNIQDSESGQTIPCNGNDVIELNGGGFLIGGKRIGGFLDGDNSGEDVFLVKTNSFGRVQNEGSSEFLDGLWVRKFGGLGDDSANALVELADGKLMVAGTNDFGGTNSTMMMLMKLNRNGELLK
ncbi:MAG: hypothetical protein JXQ96_22125 [Cyclobacteriaceae bacterium]